MDKSKYRSECPIACTLDLLGDRWTLIIVRDLFKGKKIYKELEEGPEHVPSSILAARLKVLLAEGVVAKTLYQEKPPRYLYELTDKGFALWPLLRELMRWGDRFIPESRLTPEARVAIQAD